MRKRWILLAAAVTATAGLAAACGGDDGGDERPGSANEIVLSTSDELSFDPDEIQARVGKPVRLTIDNLGTALHDFTIEEIAVEDVMAEGSDSAEAGEHGMDVSSAYDLHVAVDGGETGTLEFTPMEVGTYAFRCTEPGHTEGGMTGELVVTG